jgi:hypothetical protein
MRTDIFVLPSDIDQFADVRKMVEAPYAGFSRIMHGPAWDARLAPHPKAASEPGCGRGGGAHVLAQLAAVLAYNRNRDTGGTLRDTNGNGCGAWDYHPGEP